MKSFTQFTEDIQTLERAGQVAPIIASDEKRRLKKMEQTGKWIPPTTSVGHDINDFERNSKTIWGRDGKRWRSKKDTTLVIMVKNKPVAIQSSDLAKRKSKKK